MCVCVRVEVGGGEERRGLAKRGEKCVGVGRGGGVVGGVGVWGGGIYQKCKSNTGRHRPKPTHV